MKTKYAVGLLDQENQLLGAFDVWGYDKAQVNQEALKLAEEAGIDLDDVETVKTVYWQ
jgi:hypothetical protein